MTNREWLQSLNDDDFLQIVGQLFFEKLLDAYTCKGDDTKKVTKEVREQVKGWLSADTNYKKGCLDIYKIKEVIND